MDLDRCRPEQRGHDLIYSFILLINCVFFLLIRKYASTFDRYCWEARFVTSTFDVSPKGLADVERFLRNEESILRFFTIKAESAATRFNSRSYKNPYLEVNVLKKSTYTPPPTAI